MRTRDCYSLKSSLYASRQDGSLGVAGVLFPLTPTLSLGEREPRSPVFGECKRVISIGARASILPLPEGEGWGVGEPALRQQPTRGSDEGAFRSGIPPARFLSVLLLGIVTFVVGCGKRQEPQAATAESLPAAVVRVQKIESVKQPGVEEVVGTVQPKLQAVIEAKVSGRITRLAVNVGQSVKQGEVLVELATQEIQAKLDQATAGFRQAEQDFTRVSNLHKQTAATQAELDTAQARYNVAKAAVAEAEAVSGYAKIVAPFDGVVARKLADEGDLAMPGKPLLELEGRAGLRLVADIPNLLAGQVLADAKLAVRVDAQADPISGTVAEISPTADPASRTVRVKVDLPETAGLRSGQFGRLAVPVSEAMFIFVPAQALVRRGQLEILFVAAGGKGQMRLVRTGKQTAQGIEILAGLAAGEAVVVEGAGNLRDGQPLQLR
jgi:RND family efflux transporter MFP subunit